ncbi:hypothetical protein KQI84_13820 [bacterium]|nr:hypothetical protein [bacterium]
MPHLNLKTALFLVAIAMLAVGGWAQFTIPSEHEPFHLRVLKDTDEIRPREGPLKVLGLDDRPKLRDQIEDLAYEARIRIARETLIDWDGTAYIVWVEDEDDFIEQTGFRPEHIAAAASAEKLTVWINATAWHRSPLSAQSQVLTHELGHLLVGNLPTGRRLPLWMNEGLVQHLSGEWDARREMALARARVFGTLPRLEDLEEQFPRDPEMQTLAYAVSYKAVDLVAASVGDDPGHVGDIMRQLAHDDYGPRLTKELWDPKIRDAWNARLTLSLGSRMHNLFILMTTGTAFWILIIMLTVLAYFILRHRRRIRAQREAVEEAWAESLTEEDVYDIYGRPEEDSEPEELTPWERHLLEKEQEEDEHWL